LEFNKSNLIKSPLNYVGGKYKLLPQILPLFPNQIKTFVDLFTGGCNVGINVEARTIVCNDISNETINMYKYFKVNDKDKIIINIDNIIKAYELSKTNKQGFLQLRDEYNRSKNPLLLYVLSCYSFNYRIRFNDSNQFNEAFGANRSSFNNNLRERLLDFVDVIKEKDIQFTTNHFKDLKINKLNSNDLIYCDPPYLITDTAYNKHWTQEVEKQLLNLLDELHNNGIKFALSNVLENKGKLNNILIEWSKKYNIYNLDHTYNNCSFSTKEENKGLKTEEVLITNYEVA
jgi:DNA adenine methylase Dam